MARIAAVALCGLVVACGSSPSPAQRSTSTVAPTGSTAPTPTPRTDCLGETAPPDATPGAPHEVDALTSIQFVSQRQGWAAGRGYIVATVDGGADWSTQYEGPAQLTAVDFVDSSTGWAVATDRLLGTADGGRCWVQLAEPAQPLVSVHFVDARRGWGVTGASGPRPGGLPNAPLVGDGGGPVQPAGGRLVVTDDGGATWRAIVGAPGDVQSACFSDADHGWLGAAGLLYRSEHGGASWHVVPGLPHRPGGPPNVVSLQCGAPNSVWLLDLSLEGAAGNQPYAAYASTGGGPLVELFEHMFGGTVDRSPPGSYPGPLSVISATTAAFAGNTPALSGNPAGFEEATVTGASVSISHVVPVSGIDRPIGAAFVSASVGWLVAEAGSDAVILATSDGGRTWSRQYTTPG